MDRPPGRITRLTVTLKEGESFEIEGMAIRIRYIRNRTTRSALMNFEMPESVRGRRLDSSGTPIKNKDALDGVASSSEQIADCAKPKGTVK